MKNRIFQVLRVLVCVIVICALLVNVSPIRAEASVAAVTAWLWVNKDIVIACALAALGVTIGTNPEAFNGVVNDCATFLETTTTWVTNGTIAVLGFNDPLLVKSYLPRDLLQSIWEWLFTSDVVVNTIAPVLTPAHENVFGKYFSHETVSLKWYSFEYFDNGARARMVSGSFVFCPVPDITVSYGNSLDSMTSTMSKIEYNGRLYSYYSVSSGASGTGSTDEVVSAWHAKYAGTDFMYMPGFAIADILGYCFEGLYDTSLDLTIGQIQSPYLTTGTETEEEILKIEIAPIYVDWGTGEVSQKPPGSDEKIPWWPVGVPSIDYDDAIQQDQQTGQSGQTDLDFDFETSTDPGTGTDPDTGGGSGDGTGTGTGTGTGSNAINDFVNVSPGDFVFDVPWMDFFPFCIPKDILDLVRVFNAEPEAPRFVFDIDFPYMDEPWHIDIDFSAWDPVALVMRRMELLLFVVGLAMATRNYYIRG